MSAQTKYGYSTPIGAAGGIVDVAPHQIDTFPVSYTHLTLPTKLCV